MTTDPIFYRLFETSPETFFLLLGMSALEAADMAKHYQYQAIEFKETSHRSDGIFLPNRTDLPIYFLEVQFYPLPSVYADILAKAYTFLKQNDPAQPFCAVVLFGNRALEPRGLAPYRPLLDADVLRPFFLDELPDSANAPLGLSILSLILQPETKAPVRARELIVRARNEIADEATRSKLVELIETIIIYKLPRLTREEIQAMLQVHDIRETRIYQEAKEEGVAEEKMRLVTVMLQRNMPVSEIAEILGMNVEQVQRISKNKPTAS